MKIEVICDKSFTVKAVNMHPGQIGKLQDAVEEVYVVRQVSGFLKIWPKSNCFETTSVVPANWYVLLLPEGTVLNLTF
jgi:hypothetical protein